MKISELEAHLEHLKRVVGDVDVRGVKYACGESDNYSFEKVQVGLDSDSSYVIEIV